MKQCRQLCVVTLMVSAVLTMVLMLAPTPLHITTTYTDPSPISSKAVCVNKPRNWIWPMESECLSCAAKSNRWANTLPDSVVDRVQYLLLFTGHGRSGGSIVGSLIDAHPNAVVANQYMLFLAFIRYPAYHDTKGKLFGKIVYYAQHQEARKSMNRKGYNLTVGNGTHVDKSTRLTVIGDKGAGAFAGRYVSDPERFAEVFNKIKETAQVPVKVIQVVRNPFDNIATEVIYRKGNANLRVELVSGERSPLRQDEIAVKLECAIHKYFSQVYAIIKMESALKLDLLRVHLVDLVNNPRQYMKEICTFLDLECTEEYLKQCEDTLFSELSQTRGLVEWRPDQSALVQELIDEVPWLRRYSFTHD